MSALSLEEKEKQTIKIMGATLPRWQDCKRCKAKLACVFGTYGYDQPCPKCKSTREYLEEVNRPKGTSMDEAFKSQQVASVFEGNGRTYYVNHKGNVIKDEPSRPLEIGKKDWK